MMRMLRREDGQALILVALAILSVLGALALAIDWGYGLTQRRVSQNAADAAAIAAARALATSTELVNGNVAFRMSREALFCVAETYADKNRQTLAPSDSRTDIRVQLGDGTPAGWSDVGDPGCPWNGTGTVIPANTDFVRVVASIAYRSLVASIVGQPRLTAQASARAQVLGTTQNNYPVWPMVRHYDKNDFAANCGTPCDPLKAAPITFWSSQGSALNKNMVFGSFKGLVDFSRYSPRLLSLSSPVKAEQLIEAWDQRWSRSTQPPGSLQRDESGNCASDWDTAGDEKPNIEDKQCSIPNWTFYTFGGRVSLDEDWSSAGALQGREKPSDIGPRDDTVCKPGTMPPGLIAPSCASGAHGKGDWIETAPNGNLGDNISSQMLQYIRGPNGFTTDLSDQVVPGGGSTKYGRAAVIEVYLWDCAESFNANSVGNQWQLQGPSEDCSQITDSGSVKVDRVHLFTAAPFTFYEGLVSTSKIQGFWGGAFGDPKFCAANPTKCGLPNAFSNTALLVPDDD